MIVTCLSSTPVCVCADCRKSSDPWENILIRNIVLVSIRLEMLMSHKFVNEKNAPIIKMIDAAVKVEFMR